MPLALCPVPLAGDGRSCGAALSLGWEGMGVALSPTLIEHSVILESSHILKIERLADSVIGRGTEVVKGEQNFKAVRLFIGDDARVEL